MSETPQKKFQNPASKNLIGTRLLRMAHRLLWKSRNLMGSRKDYLAQLHTIVQRWLGCSAVHVRTVHVHEVTRGRTVWQGDVEVYKLTGNSKAKRAYAWNHCAGLDMEGERLITMLEVPPVLSAETAVRMQIAKDAKAKK